jgi:flagellar basal-body rod protein FlgF
VLRGLYTAASGLQAESLRQKNIANDIANVNTPGYKSFQKTFKSYKDLIVTRSTDNADLGTISRGVEAHNTTFNFVQGPIKQTSNPLDIALSGQGFLPIQTLNGNIEYTRSGHFTLDSYGFVVNQHGEKLLDTGFSPVYIGIDGITDISIQPDGQLYVNNEYSTTLGAFEFPRGAQIISTTGDKFDLYNKSLSMNLSQQVQFQQGVLEMSNVSSVKSTTDMISTMRAYEANEKIIKSANDTLRMLMDVGRI